MNRLVALLQRLSVPNLQSMDLASDLQSPITAAPEIFLRAAPRLSTSDLYAFNQFHPFPPLDSITTSTIPRGAPIPIIQLLSLLNLRHPSIVCKNQPWVETIRLDT